MDAPDPTSVPFHVPSGRLGFGMQLPVVSLSRAFAARWERTAGPKAILDVARAADEAGFTYVAACDHTVVPRAAAEAMSTQWYDPVATLGAVAAVTSTVRLLTHVYVLALRHPLMAASQFATLDSLSGGRVICGLGAGHLAGEFAALGVDFVHRGALLDEAVVAFDAALRTEYPDHDGPRWPFHDLGIAPRPVQEPRPPIWIAGSSHPALRRAARFGDGWLPQSTTLEELPEHIAYLREHREAAGRGDEPIDISMFAPTMRVPTGGSVPDEVPDWVRTGSADELAEGLRALQPLGVTSVQLRFWARDEADLAEQVRAFGSEIAPLL